MAREQPVEGPERVRFWALAVLLVAFALALEASRRGGLGAVTTRRNRKRWMPLRSPA